MGAEQEKGKRLMIKPNSFTPISLTLSAAAIVGAILGTVGTANADAVADFYKGRQIAIVHTGGPAGGFALYTRILAKHIVNHIPGRPTAVIQFKGGGGGMVGMNYLSVAAPKDGSYFLMPLPGVEAQPFLYPKKVKFDVTKINWIGNILKMQSFVSISASSKVKSWKDATKQVVTLGASGKGSETYIMPMLMNAVLGTKFKVITGYKGIMASTNAWEKGELDGRAGGWTSNMRPSWFKEKPSRVRLLVQSGDTAIDMLYPGQKMPSGVPLLKSLAKNEEDKRLLGLVSRTLARAVAGPPGMPKARTVAMRKAFDATLKDPAYLKEMNDRKLAIIEPQTGAQVEEYIAYVASTPKSIVKRYITAVRK
ncbi:MAG: tripartite-type tricarboxylate transporter receptor subunit TctC [Alphaproteobacteria bacterium]|jgi:tripartite-type tricarboxylate transporter receptor subunit TctC